MAYQNELETWFTGLPSQVQDVFNFAYTPIDSMLKSVAGDPDDLVRAGSVYTAVGPQVTAAGSDVSQQAGQLAGYWTGAAHDAFVKHIAQLQQTLTSLGTAIGDTDQILQAGAQAAVDGANTIVDIVVTAVEFAVSTLALSLALSVLSFGTSLAAWFAEQAANVALTLSRVAQVVEKVAVVLEKIAQVLEEIAEVLKTVAQILKNMKEFVTSVKMLPKGLSADALGTFAGEKLWKYIINKGVNALPGPNTPSGISGLKHLVGDLGGLDGDVDKAQAVG